MNGHQFIATVYVFKGENEIDSEAEHIMEVVDFHKESGRVEFGVDGPKGTRIFLTINVAELVAAAVTYIAPAGK